MSPRDDQALDMEKLFEQANAFRLRLLAAARNRGARPGKAGDDQAWQLLVGALSFLHGGKPAWAPMLVPGGQPIRARILEAHDALVGGAMTSDDAELIKQIDFSLTRGRRGEPWPTVARDLAMLRGRNVSEFVPGRILEKMDLGSPEYADSAAINLVELARRLENHHVAEKSARVPNGKWTTPQIAAFLTGDPNTAKRVAKLLRQKKRI